MTIRSLGGLALLFTFVCAGAAISLPNLAAQVLASTAAIVTAFLLGIGVGERSNGAYSQELTRINRLLGAYANDLAEDNLRKLTERPRQLSQHGESPTAEPDHHGDRAQENPRHAPSGPHSRGSSEPTQRHDK